MAEMLLWHDAREVPEYDSKEEHLLFLPDAAEVNTLASTLVPINF